MKRKDLKPGMVVELRNGDRFFITIMKSTKHEDIVWGFNEFGWQAFTGGLGCVVDDDLESNQSPEYGIVAVYELEFYGQFSNLLKTENLKLIWKRPENNDNYQKFLMERKAGKAFITVRIGNDKLEVEEVFLPPEFFTVSEKMQEGYIINHLAQFYPKILRAILEAPIGTSSLDVSVFPNKECEEITFTIKTNDLINQNNNNEKI